MIARGGPAEAARGGFTLIEVIGALVIFSAGVLLIVGLSGALSLQMQRSALRSELVLRGQERMEELERQPFASLTVGTEVDTIELQGREFERTVTISEPRPLVRQIELTIEAIGQPGPNFSATSYVTDSW